MQALQLTRAKGKMIINCVVIDTPIGINPKILAANSSSNRITKIKEVLVNFSCLLKILKITFTQKLWK